MWLGNINHVEKYVELPTKHEPSLKLLQEESPKTSLTQISLIKKVEQSLDGLRKLVTPQFKCCIWDVILMSIYFVDMYMYRRRLCAYCMWQSMIKH